jgi:hypothetical protein
VSWAPRPCNSLPFSAREYSTVFFASLPKCAGGARSFTHQLSFTSSMCRVFRRGLRMQYDGIRSGATAAFALDGEQPMAALVSAVRRQTKWAKGGGRNTQKDDAFREDEEARA